MAAAPARSQGAANAATISHVQPGQPVHPPAAALVIAFRAHARHGAGRCFTTLPIEGLTGLLAVLTVVLPAGGYATIGRLAV
jgi:hypothetical protein